MSIFRRTNFQWKDVLLVFHYDTWASESRPERVRLCVHTTEPTGPVPEPFHCDHITRWSARSGTTGPSGTGVNTGARLRSGTVPEPFRSQTCGVNTALVMWCVISLHSKCITVLVNLCLQNGAISFKCTVTHAWLITKLNLVKSIHYIGTDNFVINCL